MGRPKTLRERNNTELERKNVYRLVVEKNEAGLDACVTGDAAVAVVVVAIVEEVVVEEEEVEVVADDLTIKGCFRAS